MKHGSLFSGIGGFDLAAQWMGWENVFHCEWNTFGQKVLKYYWPNAISYNDITKTDFTKHRGQIDILTGGFPCQPYSAAGKRLGKADERHLWPEMLRAIREIQPRWIVGENVLGLVSWSGGLVFEEVQADLEAEGYEVQPYVLPAASVNAPHLRQRVWFVAYAKSARTGQDIGWLRGLPNGLGKWEEGVSANTNSRGLEGTEEVGRNGINVKWESEFGDTAHSAINGVYESESIIEHSDSIGQKWGMHENESKIAIRKQLSKRNARSNESTNWENFPTVSPVCYGDDGLSNRMDSITFPKWRNESIKAGGNAIVPQVAHQIFKTIEQYNNL